MNKRNFKNGETIFRQGEVGDSFFQILEGSVEIILDREKPDSLLLATLKKDQYLGEMAVIERYPRSATAIAGPEGAELLEITSSETAEYLHGDPDRCIALMKHLGSRLAGLSEDYKEAAGLLKEICRDSDGVNKSSFAEKIKKYIRFRSSDQKSVDTVVSDAILLEKYGEHSQGFFKKVEKYPAGTVICKEDQTGNCMYDIHWGKVGIFRGYGTDAEIKLTELFPNTFFGEMGLINHAPRSATAVALEDTTLEVIFEEDLKELFEKNPPKAGMILAHLSKRLRKLTEQYEYACELVGRVNDAWGNNQPVSGELLEMIRSILK